VQALRRQNLAGILRSSYRMTTSKLLPRILFAGVLLSACASGPRVRPEKAPPVSDSAPDKIAAQRSATGLHQEEEDQRWGFTAARELRQRNEQRKARPPAPPPTAPGPVYLEQPVAPGAL
jgi:hypothetical protein